MTNNKQYDAVVVGSGLGGLTAGALLAKAGYSVCLLERNFSLGGAASVYRVGALTVESSLHQTSDPRNPRDVKHHILSELGILDEIEWLSTGPLYNVSGGPVGDPFTMPAGFGAAHDALAARFPDKSRAIGDFLHEVEQIHDSLWTMKQAREERSFAKFTRALGALGPAASGWNDTLDEVFTREFAGCEALKCALGANLLYFGDDPKRTWWTYYALAQGANIASGGAYIKGGSRQLSLKLAKAITKAGGVVRLGRLANAIETDADGQVIAVRHVARKSGDDEERLTAKVVMANCAPQAAGDLMPAAAKALMDAAFGGRELSTSLFCANFGLKAKPSTVGLTEYSAIVLPQEMTRFDQYGDGATAMSAAPGASLPLYSIANFTAVDAGLWDEPPVLPSVLGLDRLSNWEGLTREAGLDRRERWLDAFQSALDRRLSWLFVARHRPRAAQRLFDGGLSRHAARRRIRLRAAAARGDDSSGFPRTPRTPIGGLYLASAFGGEHGFNGAMLSGAEAARLAVARLETPAS